jgi:hypothetical protein
VVYHCLRVAAADALGKDALYVASYPAGIVQVVDHQIQHHPARLVKVDEPVVGGFLGLERLPGQAYHGYLADLPLLGCSFGLGILWEEANYVCYQQLDAGCRAGSDHLLPLLHGAGERLLTEDVLPRRSRLEYLRVMQVGGCADIQHIHVCEHRRQVRIGSGPVLLRQRPGAFFRSGQKACDLGFCLSPGRSVGAAHKADARDSNAHACLPPSWKDVGPAGTVTPGLFDGSGRQTPDQLPGEDNVKDKHRYHGQRQRG